MEKLTELLFNILIGICWEKESEEHEWSLVPRRHHLLSRRSRTNRPRKTRTSIKIVYFLQEKKIPLKNLWGSRALWKMKQSRSRWQFLKRKIRQLPINLSNRLPLKFRGSLLQTTGISAIWSRTEPTFLIMIRNSQKIRSKTSYLILSKTFWTARWFTDRKTYTCPRKTASNSAESKYRFMRRTLERIYIMDNWLRPGRHQSTSWSEDSLTKIIMCRT